METQPGLPSPDAPAEAAVQEEAYPAGFFVRGGAVAVDLLVMIFLIAVLTALGAPAPNLLGAAVGLAYKGFFISHGGQTPGKMAAGIQVITMDGGPVSLGRALLRPLAEYLSGILLCLGYLMAASANKRALHDHIAGTRVIYVEGVGSGRKTAFALLGALMASVPLLVFAVSFFATGSMGKYKTLAVKSGEGATKGNLGALRSWVSIKYADMEGQYPATLEELIDPQMLKAIPQTSLADHPKTASWTPYGAEVCLPGAGAAGSEIDHTKIKDTGGWGYVTDPKARCWGAVFVDCNHKDTKGKFWPEY